jgi:AraC-like DNA-binding protein
VDISEIPLRNRGCYDLPHSGVGMEFSPLGPLPEASQVLLHETGYLSHNHEWMFPNTVSPFWRLYYNARAGHKVIFSDHEIELVPGRTVLIPDGQVFHSHGKRPTPHFWMTFSLGMVLKEPGPIVLETAASELGQIERLCRRFTGIGEGPRFAIFHESLALLHTTVARLAEKWTQSPRSAAMQAIAAYIDEHFAEPLSVAELAKRAGISERTLSTKFRREYHVNPSLFIAQVRVREVARLLVNTTQSLEEIATRAGFSDRYYLTRVFTRIVGKPPATFRRDHQKL